MSHKHLTQTQRYQISNGLNQNKQQKEIAEEIGVAAATINREIKRNSIDGIYDPDCANKKAIKIQQTKRRGKIFSTEDLNLVKSYLREDYSPEQIEGRLNLEGKLLISHETIYKMIYKDKENGGDLYKHLRCKKKNRKRYKSGRERRGSIKNRVGINERPKIVEERSRIGDWEADTIIGGNHQGAIVTLVERKSRYTLACPVSNKESHLVKQAIIDVCSVCQKTLKTQAQQRFQRFFVK